MSLHSNVNKINDHHLNNFPIFSYGALKLGLLNIYSDLTAHERSYGLEISFKRKQGAVIFKTVISQVNDITAFRSKRETKFRCSTLEGTNYSSLYVG